MNLGAKMSKVTSVLFTFLLLITVLVIFKTSTANGATVASPTDTTTTCPPPPPCARGCEATDANGCPTCRCPTTTCQDITCPTGTSCVMSDCGPQPCFSSPICEEITTLSNAETATATATAACPPAPPCAYDCLTTDEKGCDICKCPNTTCQDISCANGTVCEMSDCTVEPCDSKPTCVPNEDPCGGEPNPNHCRNGSPVTRWTYNSSSNTCDTFHYYGCTPSPNTFKTKKSCEKECRKAPPCRMLMCMVNCTLYTPGPYECPVCICNNPCESFDCGVDKICKLRDIGANQTPKPYCAPRCPFLPRCLPPCRFRKNKEGCVVCKCKRDPDSKDDDDDDSQ